jgi:hypothetical protein
VKAGDRVTISLPDGSTHAHLKHWAVVIPSLAWAGGLASAIAIGVLAGLLPAIRAARMSAYPSPLEHMTEESMKILLALSAAATRRRQRP